MKEHKKSKDLRRDGVEEGKLKGNGQRIGRSGGCSRRARENRPNPRKRLRRNGRSRTGRFCGEERPHVIGEPLRTRGETAMPTGRQMQNAPLSVDSRGP